MATVSRFTRSVDGAGHPQAIAIQSMIALQFVCLSALPALAAQATEPRHGVVVVYDEAKWSMTRKNPHLVVLNCKDESCGGASSECMTLQFDNPVNSYAPGLLAQMNNVNKKLIGMWERNGQRLELVDKPEWQTWGQRSIALSSLRYRLANRVKRIWSAQILTQFGTTGLICASDEDNYPVATASWMLLLRRILIPGEY